MFLLEFLLESIALVFDAGSRDHARLEANANRELALLSSRKEWSTGISNKRTLVCLVESF